MTVWPKKLIAEESQVECLVERALERQLPVVLAMWAPPRWESEAQPSPTTGGSKLHFSPTVSPFGYDE